MTKCIQRARPIGGGAAIVKNRLAGPGHRRPHLGRLLGRKPRGVGIVTAARLDVEATQSQ